MCRVKICNLEFPYKERENLKPLEKSENKDDKRERVFTVKRYQKKNNKQQKYFA